MLSEKYRIIFVKSWWIVIIKLHRDFHFIYVVFVSITNMVSSLWKTSPLSPPCEGGDKGEVISSTSS